MTKSKSKFAQPQATDLADRLHSLAIHLLRRLRVKDQASGIGPAQLSALSVLVFGGSRSLRELADAEQVRPPTMSRIVAALEKSGLVRRHATEDGRRVLLEATTKAAGILTQARKRRVEALALAIRSLSRGELVQLTEIVPTLEQILNKL